MPLLEKLVLFTDDLRRAGVLVSTSELLDAVEATNGIGVAGRTMWREALRCSLVKRVEYFATFDAVFDIHFQPARRISEAGAHAPDIAASELLALLEQAIDREDDDELVSLVSRAVSQFGGMAEGRFLGVEYHGRRVMRRLGALGDMIAIGAPADELASGAASRHLGAIEAEVEREIRRRAIASGDAAALVAKAGKLSVEQLEFLRAPATDMAELHRSVQVLGRKLAAKLQRRRLHGRRGRLHAGLTVRRSLATGGVPFDPVFRRPHPHRPDVVVLADVSGSVATFARFTLQLVHALGGEFSQVRTFAFVDEVDEVTGHFRNRDFEAAMNDASTLARTIGDEGHSDYGRVFERFSSRYLTAIRPSTTVLVLGDARNNYHAVNRGDLEQIARRARRTYWLNPEPRAHWDTADSAMSAYSGTCTEVFECRNLLQLSGAIDRFT